MDGIMNQNDLKKVHEIELEILDEVVRICDNHNLKYFLIAGTLLGAIRHKGFIPWDDDLDIGMPREDYNKFIECYYKELSDKYILDYKETNEKYYLNFAKIRNKETIFEQDFQVNYDGPKGIWLDIFPFDNAKGDKSILVWLQAKLNRLIFLILHYKNDFYLSSKFLVIKKFISLIFKKVKNKTLLDIQDRILKWNSKHSEYKYFVSLSTSYNYKTELILKEKYLPLKKAEFEGRFYNIPNNPDYILKNIYGDYMKLPPEEKRITHNPRRLEFNMEEK